MPQTEFSLYHKAAIAGQVVERADGYRGQRGRYESSETLNFGRLVELHSDGKLRHPQGTSLGKVLGGVAYNPALPPGGYQAGEDIVPAFRKGQVWLEYTGTAPAVEAKPNVCHASTDEEGNAQHRGKITGSDTSSSAGEEISAGPDGIVVIKVDSDLGLALCEFNLPA